ncbi:MAG: hypothetical protein QM503_10145 [Bacteroidota bacterium]
MEPKISNNNESKYRRLREKIENSDNLSIYSIKELSTFTSPHLKDYFNSDLIPTEREKIKNIVFNNLRILINVYFIAITDEDALSNLSDRNKYEFKRYYKEALMNSSPKPDTEYFNLLMYSGSILYTVKHIFSNSDLPFIKLWGKVPKKGIFSSRQELGDKWINNINDILSNGITIIYKKFYYPYMTDYPSLMFKNTSKADTVALFFILLSISNFLIKYHKDDFQIVQDEPENEMVIRLLSEFLNKTSQTSSLGSNTEYILSNELVKYYLDLKENEFV